MAVVRAVFNSYDSSKTGELMRQDYMRILRDCNQAGQLSNEGLGRFFTCCGGVNSTEHGSTTALRNLTAICTWKHLYSIASII